MDLSVLFEPARLIFTIPLLISFLLGALALVGMFDFDGADLDLDTDLDTDADLGADLDVDAGFDADVDADVDADLDADLDADADIDADSDASSGGGLLQLLGFGYVPLTLSIVLLCFSFGWTGLLLSTFFGDPVAGVVGGGFATTGVLALPAFVAAAAITAPLSRLFAPLFRDYGKATKTRELVGKTAVLTTGSVTSSFGSASVRVPGRGPVEVSVRTDPTDGDMSDQINYGDRVLIYDHDPERNIYFVAPHTPDDTLSAEASM
jgi:hypothetical protein